MPRPLDDKRFVPCNSKVIQIPETFCLWNPESWALESGNSSRNPESRYNDWKPESKFHWQGIRNLSPGIWNPSPGIQNPSPGIWNPSPRIRNPSPVIRNPSPGTWNPTPGIWNPSPGIRNPSPGIRNPSPDIRNSLHRIQNPRLSWIPLHGAKLYSIH